MQLLYQRHRPSDGHPTWKQRAALIVSLALALAVLTAIVIVAVGLALVLVPLIAIAVAVGSWRLRRLLRTGAPPASRQTWNDGSGPIVDGEFAVIDNDAGR